MVVGTARCAVTARAERAEHARYNVQPGRLRRLTQRAVPIQNNARMRPEWSGEVVSANGAIRASLRRCRKYGNEAKVRNTVPTQSVGPSFSLPHQPSPSYGRQAVAALLAAEFLFILSILLILSKSVSCILCISR
jgi:hypothetical protein